MATSVSFAISVLAVAALLRWQLSIPVGWVWPALSALTFGHIGWLLGRGRAETPRPTSLPAAASTGGADDPGLFGRYRIERELGRGAMGMVYLGRDPKLGRAVAIKTLALGREFSGEALSEARDRFYREAETAGRLQHPDIVTIFDVGQAQDLAYIAMEYLQGDNLQAHTQAPRLLPVVTLLDVTARVADALAYAHSKGVVHRDIKPANVMIDLTEDTVKVTDFGVARIADANRTRTGLVLGTPSFMSPEQLAGRRVDGRSDLYSLGVMLYQLLTGRLPHRSESMASLMRQIANEEAVDVRHWRPELPEVLARVVARLLEKQPELRYESGHQLAIDLREIADRMRAEPHVPSPMPPAEVPPDSGGFEATVKMERAETGHNSSL